MRFKSTIQSLGTLTILMSIMTSAYAANSGFYVGVDGGRDTATIKENDNYSDGLFINSNVEANHLDGFLWGAHAGYNLFLTHHFVLGTEVFWNQSDAKLDWQHSVDFANRQLSINHSVGASVLPGWQLDSNNRLYTRLGWIQSYFDQEGNSTLLYGPTFNNTRSEGFESGLGYLVAFANRWDLRMEYDHADYNTISRSNGTDNYSYKPQLDRYTLGVDCNFDSAQIQLPDTVMLPSNGWYTAIDTGYNEANVDYQHLGTNTTQQDRSLRGYVGGLHFGYQWELWPHILMGSEVFGMMNSSSGNYSNRISSDGFPTTSNETTLREQYSYGAAVTPGYQFNAANLLYIRFGVIETQFEKTVVGTDSGPNFKTSRLGTEWGLGYQVAVTDHWSVFGEYDYAYYAQIYTSDSTGQYNYTPEDNQYKLGISYDF